jgi:hypothetical protein
MSGFPSMSLAFRARVGFGAVFVCCYFGDLKGGWLIARWEDI